jgi:tRNA pseudouridine55 synthase
LSPWKRFFNERRIGHAGTLDPLATGLLFAAVGKATRLLPFAEGRDKEYLVAVRLGIRTDTLDTDGQILSQTEEIPDVATLDWQELAKPFLGDIDQVPPSFSAISVDGVRAYDRARKGDLVELPSRRVRIDSVTVVPHGPLANSGAQEADITLRVRCGKGTYVRSLVRDLGERIGCGATVSALRRTAIGSWRLPDSWEVPAENFAPELLAAPEVFGEWPRFEVPEEWHVKLGNGNAIPCELPETEQAFAYYKGLVFAWGRVNNGLFKTEAQL